MEENTAEQIRAALEANPLYEKGSAYVRTKLCCEVMTKMGLVIPSWMVLRGYIEKGSSNDISRGVKDFRAEHASLLNRMAGLPEGVPESLGQPMQALWQAALAEATSVFEQQREVLEAERNESERAAGIALAERDEKAQELALAIEKAAGLQTAVEQERERANTERAAREQAERTTQRHITDLTQQRTEMAQVIEANTQELKTMSTRLDDERRRALMEIDHARQQTEQVRQEGIQAAERKAAAVESAMRKEMADERMEHFLLQRRHRELQEATGKLRELLNKDNKQARLKRPGPGANVPPGRGRKLTGSRRTTGR